MRPPDTPPENGRGATLAGATPHEASNSARDGSDLDRTTQLHRLHLRLVADGADDPARAAASQLLLVQRDGAA